MNEAFGKISVSWYECQVDGVLARPVSSVRPGMTWIWSGRGATSTLGPVSGFFAVGLKSEPVRLGTIRLARDAQVFEAEILQRPEWGDPVIEFFDCDPPAGKDLLILDLVLDQTGSDQVICFAAGTMIETALGPRPVESIRPCDRLWTCDRGYKDVLWAGRRRPSGAMLAGNP